MSQCGPNCNHESHEHGVPREGVDPTIEEALTNARETQGVVVNRKQRRAQIKKKQKADKRLAHLINTWVGRGMSVEKINEKLEALKSGLRIGRKSDSVETAGGTDSPATEVADSTDA